MNGNSTYQQAGKSKLNADYMRSNLPKHIRGTKDTIVNTLTDLYYDYNTHDDRIYKEIKQGSAVLGSTYYLRDGAGTELAEWDLVSNNKTYYTYGRERVAEDIGNSTNYYVNDHLGSVHLVYKVVSNCLGQPTTYRLQSATDYYAFGKVLRSYNGPKYGYQGSEKNPELGNNDYYTHFRGLDVDIARWKGVDPVFNPSESPYVSMGNNPVMNIDVLGNKPEEPVILASKKNPMNRQMVEAAKNYPYKEGDGVFTVFAHANAETIEYKDEKENQVLITTASMFDEIMKKNSPAYANARESGQQIKIILMACHSGDDEIKMPGQDVVFIKTIAQKISEEIPNVSAVAAPNGDVMFNPSIDNVDGRTVISDKSKILGVYTRENDGAFNIFKKGENVGKVEFKTIPFKYNNKDHYNSPKIGDVIIKKK